MAKPWCWASMASDFDALQSRRHDDEVQLYAFDMLAGDGDDYSLQRHRAEILVIKEPADEPSRILCDYHPIGLGERLQSGGQVRRFAEAPPAARRPHCR